jgi:hypothetical protein
VVIEIIRSTDDGGYYCEVRDESTGATLFVTATHKMKWRAKAEAEEWIIKRGE